MPTKVTLERARKARRQGKAPTTQAGEFVHEEMEHIRRGQHGARSTKQAIAIGLNKARRSGVALAPPKRGSAKTRRSAQSALRQGQHQSARRPSPRRSSAVRKALKREGRSAASKPALSRQARSAARARRKSGPSTPGAGRSGRSRTASRSGSRAASSRSGSRKASRGGSRTSSRRGNAGTSRHSARSGTRTSRAGSVRRAASRSSSSQKRARKG